MQPGAQSGPDPLILRPKVPRRFHRESVDGESELVDTLKPKNINKRYSQRFVFVFVVTTSVLLIFTAYLSYALWNIYNNPSMLLQQEAASVIENVSKLMVLPTDEQPTIATVSDPEALRDQSFFKQAKKGDKVLMYFKTQKAILYNPKENRIVEIAPISANPEQ